MINDDADFTVHVVLPMPDEFSFTFLILKIKAFPCFENEGSPWSLGVTMCIFHRDWVRFGSNSGGATPSPLSA